VGRGRRDPPNVAHLTGDSRRLLERGLQAEEDEEEDTGEVEVSEEEFRAMAEELDEIKNRLNVLTSMKNSGQSEDIDDEILERITQLETRVDEVRADSTGGDGGVTPRQVAEAPAVKKLEKRVGELETDMLDLEEYMYEWHESAETYLRALRQVVEDKLGVSLQSYLEAGEDDVDEEDVAE